MPASSSNRDLLSRKTQPPAHPPRAVGEHAGPPNFIEGEYREIHPIVPVAASPTQPAAERRGPTLLDRAIDSLKDPKQYAVLGAEFRRGLKDLQSVVLGEIGGTHDEPGTIANPTQIEVYQEKTMDSPEATGSGMTPRPVKSPLDKPREAAREAGQDKGRFRSYEIG
ncbi:hypothetical protein TA3x_000370 [Tundrisphaera sp. TA3]|uniref:hypothetical protein n=1 Tax=Tundrisphaera sp. TA3 TaxID=3435775 RepID=UPI003EBBFE9C